MVSTNEDPTYLARCEKSQYVEAFREQIHWIINILDIDDLEAYDGLSVHEFVNMFEGRVRALLGRLSETANEGHSELDKYKPPL